MPPRSRAEEIAAIKAALQPGFGEDPVNLDWALAKVDRLAWSVGPRLYSNLLLLLFNLTLEEDEARALWQGILDHRAVLEGALGRHVSFRVAALDRLVQANQSTSRPRLLDLVQMHRPTAAEMIDPLTGLHTGSYLEDQLPRELGRALRFKLALSLIDLRIDDFTSMTDRLGTTIGTVLLKEVAEIITRSIRTIDYAARLSGADFVLLLTETDRMGAYYLAERIRQQVEEFYLERRVDGRPFGLTVSAGVASFPEDAHTAEDLLRVSAEAYYSARAKGHSRVAIHHAEKREFIRLSAESDELEVSLMSEGAGTPASASMKNISSGGVLFESQDPIDLGRMVQIVCKSRRDADKVVIPGRVVRIESFETQAGTRYEIGVLFDLVVEEQLDGVVDFLERFISGAEAPSDESRPS